MTTLILEPKYSINLAARYFLGTPSFKEDWLYICLYYDQVSCIPKPGKKFNQDLIKFIDYPFLNSIKQNYTGGPSLGIEEVTLHAVRYATENNLHFLPDIERIDRDDFINFVNKHLSASIPTLKKSFLTVALLKYFVAKNIPNVGGQLSADIEKKLIDFKRSDFGKAFVNGVNSTVEKYAAFYYLTPELEQQIKKEFIEIQQEFLGKLGFEKIRSFKISSLIEDGIGIATGQLISFLPLGIIKELFNFTKTQIDFNRNKGLQFILSILYLQKILLEELKSTSEINHCVICQTTEAEMTNLKDEETSDFIFKNTNTMCLKHLVRYLNARKFGQLTGKTLLMALKNQE